MRLIHRVLCFGFFVAATAHLVLAQVGPESNPAPTEKIIHGWLQSGDPRLVAWGAHDALASRSPNFAPDLLALANQWQPLTPEAVGESGQLTLSTAQKERRFAMAAVLDALIQMNVAVPPDDLRNLAPDFQNDVAVLLGRLPNEASAAVEMEFYRAPAEKWRALQYVSAALLALHPTAEFAGDLLSHITVHANIFVVLPGTGAGSGGSGFSCMVGDEKPGESWPSIGQYKLWKTSSDGARTLVAGIDPVFVTREESYGYMGDGCATAQGIFLGEEQRRELIAEMLGVKAEEMPWESGLQINIEFQSAEQFRTALQGFVGEEEQKFQETAEALEARNLLARSEARESLPKLQLWLHDERGAGAEPLSKDMLLPDRVEWASQP
jgi:hypothetical protein